MPTWGQIGIEIYNLNQEYQKAGTKPGPLIPSPVDVVRRKYLRELSEFTGRPVIVYASGWMEGRPVPDPGLISVSPQDMIGFMETVKGLPKGPLDLMLHSPGGSADTAQAIMKYLRSEGFNDIRAVVPIAAMSAATMMALSSDAILMGNHSQLGPIDPQFTIATVDGPRQAPAQAILDQFELAKTDMAAHPAAMGAWLPILRTYGPGLLSQCTTAQKLAEDMVARELEHHMFKFMPSDEAHREALRVAAWFNDHSTHLSHGRAITISDAASVGVKVIALEGDDDLQDKVLSAWHGVQHSLSAVPVNKIIENHTGAAWITQAQTLMFGPQQAPAKPQPIQIPKPQNPAVQGQNRNQRRRKN